MECGIAIDEFVKCHRLGDSVPDMSQNEAYVRNRLLLLQYGRLPTYAHFRAIDLDRESESCRIAWWRETFGVDPTNPAPVFECLSNFMCDQPPERS